MSKRKKAADSPGFWFIEPIPAYLNFWLFKAHRVTGNGKYSSFQTIPSGVTVRIVTAGEWSVRMSGVSRKARAGDMFCAIPSETIHFLQTENSSWGWHEIQFNGPACEKFIGEFGLSRDNPVVTPDNPSEAIRIFKNIYNYIEDEKRTVSGMLSMVFDLISTCGKSGVETAGNKIYSRDMLVAKAVDILESLPDINKNISELAEDLGVDRTTLYRAFKNKMGKSPHEYIDWFRMIRAKELLTCTDMPVSVIARRTGFADAKYFISWFKEKHKMPPGAWRQKCKSSIHK